MSSTVLRRPVKQTPKTGMTVVIQQPEEAVRIPAWVSDLATFRQWAKSDDFPQGGWFAHLGGDLWVDPSMERLGHNKVKLKVGAVLAALVEDAAVGTFIGDRMLLTNVVADLSTEPDGMFISYKAQREERVRLERGDDSLEVEGTPDMVLEVVSPTSVQKDTVVLRDLYWRAGIPEFWLIDPRGAEVIFDVLRYGSSGYVATRKQGSWLKSPVFGKSFRLTRQPDPLGNPRYALEVR